MEYFYTERLNNFFKNHPEGVYFPEGKEFKINNETILITEIAGIEGDNPSLNSKLFMQYYFEKDDYFDEYNDYELDYEDLYFIGSTISGKSLFVCLNKDSKCFNNVFFEDYENEIFVKIFVTIEDFFIFLDI